MVANVDRSGRPGSKKWPASLDLEALAPAGWRPTPFRQFLLKIHSRCNLACDYCYVYTMADQSWRSRPMAMDRRVLRATADRIAEHTDQHGLDRVKVILHGGEPLLVGPAYLGEAVTLIRERAGPSVTVDFTVQTNGVLLDQTFLAVFRNLGVRVGISLDGDATAHDRHRRFANGRGSHAEVTAALRLLARPEHRDSYAGLLCTVNLGNDPASTYQALLQHEPPMLDLLLPHGNWSSPPPGRSADQTLTPYADWLIGVFDRWYGAPVRETSIRLFDEILHLLLGGASATEVVGLTSTSLIVVETDGALEQGDTLKSAYPGAPGTGLHVSRNSFDEALRLPSIAARQIGVQALSGQCQACRFRPVCGGGLYAHRYRADNGFQNPSVYCADLYKLIQHIRDRVTDDLRPLRYAGTGSGAKRSPG